MIFGRHDKLYNPALKISSCSDNQRPAYGCSNIQYEHLNLRDFKADSAK